MAARTSNPECAYPAQSCHLDGLLCNTCAVEAQKDVTRCHDIGAGEWSVSLGLGLTVGADSQHNLGFPKDVVFFNCVVVFAILGSSWSAGQRGTQSPLLPDA